MLFTEAQHRILLEQLTAAFDDPPDQRQAIDLRTNDFNATIYLAAHPDQRSTLRLSIRAPDFQNIAAQLPPNYFENFYKPLTLQPTPEQGFSLTLIINLDQVTNDQALKKELVQKLSAIKRDVMGAVLWVNLQSLLTASPVDHKVYTVNYKEGECMYVLPPKEEVVVVVFCIDFESQVEQAIAKVFLQEIEISRRQSRDLLAAPAVNYTQEPPRELKVLELPDARGANSVGYVSLAISKRHVHGGKLEKVISLIEGYRNFLMYHVKGTKSQLHTRIRNRSNSWLQVLNRAMPEKLDKEKKTITGRTFKR